MERFFLELLNRAICAGWMVLVILLLRVVLKKVPKWTRGLLWGMVAVRLIVPIQIESTVSLIPSAHTVSPDVMYAEKPEVHTGIGLLNSTVNPVISDYFAPKPEYSANPLQVLATVASWVWLAGMVLLLFYAAASYVRLRMLVRTAVPVRWETNVAVLQDVTPQKGFSSSVRRKTNAVISQGEGGLPPEQGAQAEEKCKCVPVLESERVDSPFVLGWMRPRIYLPMGIKEADRNYIISHEMAHIHRKDHWIKPFGYILLAVYWFWPLLWVAYVMLCRDIEYACDERVVKRYDLEERKAYSTALLTCSVRRFRIAACPIAFGEVGVKQRVKGVLHYKKPAFWALLLAALCCVIVAVCFLTNPKTGGDADADGMAQGGETDAGDGSDTAGGNGTGEGNGTNGAGSGNGGAGTGGEGDGYSIAGMNGTGDGTVTASDGEIVSAGIVVPAEGWYEFDHCIYMNLFSSYFPFESQRMGGYLSADGLTWNEFGQQQELFYEKAPDDWNVDTMPWTMFEAQELENMFRFPYDRMGTELDGMDALPAEKRLWRPLENGYRLLYVGGELWLMRLGSEEAGVWSIYALRPQEDALSDAIAKAAWNRAEETGAFGGVTRTEAAAEGVTGELWATYPCVSCVVLATEGAFDAGTGGNETLTVYAQVLATAFLCENTGITELGGSYGPAAITFLVDEDGSYTLLEYWTPRDGSYYVTDIREKFPETVADAAIDGQRYINALMRESYAKAVSETGVVDTWSVVHRLFNRMLEDEDGLLKEDADAQARLAGYPLTFRELTYYGDYTLRYIYSQFMSGGESGLKGGLMARVMDDLISEEVKLRMPLDDGQAYFDALCESTRDSYEDLLLSQGGEAQAKQFMREEMPAQYLLFSMLEQSASDAEAPGQVSERPYIIDDYDAAVDGGYEYYLTEEQLMADIEAGYLFCLNTAFSNQKAHNASAGTVYRAPYVEGGSWPFYVHEDNIIDLEIAFSDLCRKPNKNMFPGDERIIVEVISPDGQSVYRFEKVGDEITKDTSVQEQIPVASGKWTLQISFAYVCGEVPAHLKIAAAYENPTEEDLNWLKKERLANREGI